jgi:hypothetical protein
MSSPIPRAANREYQIVCSRAGFYLDEGLGYSDFGGSDGSGFDLSVWKKGFNAPGPQKMYFV